MVFSLWVMYKTTFTALIANLDFCYGQNKDLSLRLLSFWLQHSLEAIIPGTGLGAHWTLVLTVQVSQAAHPHFSPLPHHPPGKTLLLSCAALRVLRAPPCPSNPGNDPQHITSPLTKQPHSFFSMHFLFLLSRSLFLKS